MSVKRIKIAIANRSRSKLTTEAVTIVMFRLCKMR